MRVETLRWVVVEVGRYLRRPVSAHDTEAEAQAAVPAGRRGLRYEVEQVVEHREQA